MTRQYASFNHSSRQEMSAPTMPRQLTVVHILLAMVIVALGSVYLVQINGLATKGYQIKDLEQQVNDLKLENSDLQLQSLGLQSMDAVKDKVGTLDMVSANSADYLAARPVAVAR